MSEQSDRMMMLLQELALLKQSNPQDPAEINALRKRRTEIGEEIKDLAAEKKQREAS